jgi:hypothetical protein
MPDLTNTQTGKAASPPQTNTIDGLTSTLSLLITCTTKTASAHQHVHVVKVAEAPIDQPRDFAILVC